MPYAQIDISAYRSNLDLIRFAAGESCSVMAVVKSDAYGFGLQRMAKEAYRSGIRHFGIASVDEALRLREIFCDRNLSIIRLSPTIPEECREIVENAVIPVISSEEEAFSLSKEALRLGKVCLCHLGLDTGMGRLGFKSEALFDSLSRMNSLKGIAISGLFSHFSCADEEDSSFSLGQLRMFQEASARIESALSRRLCKHMANSSALFRFPESRMDLVRTGIATYGAQPSNSLFLKGLKPVMTVRAKVVLVKKMCKGDTISYGRTFKASDAMTAALVDAGYGEGYSRLFSSKGFMLVNGKKAAVAGRVTMDMTVLDVTAAGPVHAGDEAVLIGRQGGAEIRAEEYASQIGTIPYEVFCVFGKVLKRSYTE